MEIKKLLSASLEAFRVVAKTANGRNFLTAYVREEGSNSKKSLSTLFWNENSAEAETLEESLGQKIEYSEKGTRYDVCLPLGEGKLWTVTYAPVLKEFVDANGVSHKFWKDSDTFLCLNGESEDAAASKLIRRAYTEPLAYSRGHIKDPDYAKFGLFELSKEELEKKLFGADPKEEKVNL